jgi:ABC-type phosphate transport system ATPase subunit
MEKSWMWAEIKSMRESIKRMIPHVVERAARGEHLWDQVADDLIDARDKLSAALKVQKG